ncbi:exodeoxyribonuclease V beta chain [Halorhodospira halochloris]|uniref:RecBCD enzyme subunit RecB n=1 Tax=Halorhodospira halochloris TaxID=1052 RepID=A0A0X8X794_HALHR|nr:exodeoxyribonuclease V subunit beta [Halorhodospira halochloris]MBK1652293.1 exodeoxyribonuclease V subunit beta [Halorhodospira halochloris]BAU56910.1 exodeoxyribonuclease V beta chain [Halorhodospira halochloris]
MSSTDPTTFLLQFPLHGSRLIEASAGTGKTYAIAALYVRLVLDHGADNAFGKRLLPPQILVMTFTEAATQELRDRIRARLTDAARCFRGRAALASGETPLPGAVPDDPDDFLNRLCDDWPAAHWPAAAHRLEEAAQWMDEAAVTTIHAWCLRMLREHAFDSGSLFHQELSSDETELRDEAVHDYWRRHVLPRSADELGLLFEFLGRTPAALLKAIDPLLKQTDTFAAADQETLERRLAAQLAALERAKAPWRDDFEAILASFEQARPGLNGNAYRTEPTQRRLQAMHEWACRPGQLHPRDPVGNGDKDLLIHFSRAEMRAKLKKGKSLPDDLHPAFAALDDQTGLVDPVLESDLLTHAATWIRQRLDAEKRRRAMLGFNDLLTRLRDALDHDAARPDADGGGRLARTIRRQFPVALVDEFQDTDPVQYAIFDRIYDVAADDPSRGLLLIGDPKQAIFGFRGADIHSYLQARQATTGRHATLGTNFRSTEGAVAAVNRLFGQANGHPEGPFLFREDDSSDDPLPFQPVAANGRAETLVFDGVPLTPLTLWHWPDTEADEQAVTSGVYRRRAAASCASAMVELLEAGRAERCGFSTDSKLEPLRPRDMAVLVRSRIEADAIRYELSRRGVRSVYLSDRESVYATPEAVDLLHWLRACAEPESGRRLRAALATATLDRPLAELDRLNHDERFWEERVLQFRGYREIWQQQGVLAMVRRLLHDFDLPRHLLAETDGERRLTNLLHLGELLQRAAVAIDGEHALIRFLAEHCNGDGESADDQILRLESDEALVRVVTIHKSKGLEYPLVFLPFIASFRAKSGRETPLFVRRATEGCAEPTRPQPVFEPTDEDVRAADDERLAEDLRLLYVATTRARHATWMGIAPLAPGGQKQNQLHRSAIGYLLNGREALANDAVKGAMERLAGDSPAIRVAPLPQESDPDQEGGRYHGAAESQTPGRARTPTRRVKEPWWIASYSALPRAEAEWTGAAEAPETAAAATLSEELAAVLTPPALPVDQTQLQPTPLAPAPGGSRHYQPGMFDGDNELRPPSASPEVVTPALHDFPPGPGPGTFLHGLLEWAAEAGFGQVVADPAELREVIARRCQRRGWTAWIDQLGDWVLHLLQAPLLLPVATSPLQLANLTRYQPELEFWLETHWVDARRIDEAVTAATLNGEPRPAMAPKRLNGLLKGFIDLAFEHEGRYYVADYKSNRLGESAAEYTPEAVRAALLNHRYDLQGVLYTVALHRQLKARLPDYDYDRHMGGSVTLFLRGLDAEGQGLHCERPPRTLIETLDAALRDGPDRPAGMSEQGARS